jgi:radical SAM superfamily enzyme YgiQ (UPF0313 family)
MRVMLVSPNDRMDGLISIGISILSSHLKAAKHGVRLYDTTFIDTGKETGDSYREGLGQVKKVDSGSFDSSRKRMTERELVEDFRKSVRDYSPGLVGFSTLEVAYDQGLILAKGIKDMNIPIIFGGAYPTSSPRIVLREPAIDMICEGEGELMLPELATALERGEDIRDIYNLTVKSGGSIYQSGIKVKLEDLATGDDIFGEKTGLRRRQTHMGNELLSPDYTIYNDRRFFKKMGGKVWRTAAFEISRGCPFKCTFCCTPMQRHQHEVALENRVKLLKLDGPSERKLDPHHREKPIDKAMKEIKQARDEFGINFVYFTDESFLSMSPGRFEEFIRNYKEIKLPFFIESRVETVKPGYARELEDAGCTGIAMGVESGSPELRKKLLGRFMSDGVLVRGFKEFEKTEIRISANNIIGFPGETREDIMRTIEINRKINPDSMVVNAFRPYSGTELRKVCIEKGLIPKEERAEDNRTYNLFSNGVLSSEELEGLRRTFPLYVLMDKSRWDEIRTAEVSEEKYNQLKEETVGEILNRKTRKISKIAQTGGEM